VQLEGIALDLEAENGIASIGSVDANNLGFSQTQATQASQVCTVIGCIESLPKHCAADQSSRKRAHR